MAYSSELANRVREYLLAIPKLKIEEKNMFGGLAFMINDKMCINVGEDMLMCRFD
ncbi:TfoX/Sxy family protein [Albibacterium indicum]|uniref:TfoX/Sxy family protein n=1 Tax=Albibacterium indicum TaxID=2292082 RepID=UPI000E548DFB|nr:TfoX/Sxy family protein [Pedobacter indicus]